MKIWLWLPYNRSSVIFFIHTYDGTPFKSQGLLFGLQPQNISIQSNLNFAMLYTMSKVNKWTNVNLGTSNASTFYHWLVHLVDLFHLTASRTMHCYLCNHKWYKGLAIGNEIYHVYPFILFWNSIWVLFHLCKKHQLWFSCQKSFWFYLG